MAGTLTISTLSDGTNSTSSTNCIQGSAKAWACWDGSNGTIRASYNISSITRNSINNFTANFTNAFADTNYVFTGATGYDNANQTTWIGSLQNVARSTWKQTGLMSFVFTYVNGSPGTGNPSDACLVIYR